MTDAGRMHAESVAAQVRADSLRSHLIAADDRLAMRAVGVERAVGRAVDRRRHGVVPPLVLENRPDWLAWVAGGRGG